jgi:glutamine synthetase
LSDRRVVSPEELTSLIAAGEVDTVLACFPDWQGRLMGKRVTGRHYLSHVAGPDGFEACDYLMATDVDMTPLPGFGFASAEQGYGDMRAVADGSTIRLIPWLDRTALVLCDLVSVSSGEPVEVAPRTVLRRQMERAASMGIVPMVGSEIEFFLFRDSFEEAHDSGYRGLTPYGPHNQDYDIRQTTRDEFLIRQIRNAMEGAGVPVEYSKGEAEAGQHEINLRYAAALEMADRNAIYKNGVKEIAALAGHAVTFMAKYDFARVGSSGHIHASLVDTAGRSLFFEADADGAMTATFRSFLAGCLAATREFSLLWAPTVNSYKRFQPGSWAASAIVWGADNRTCGYRVVGHGESLRVENRIAGADMNSYIAFAGMIAAGLTGISAGMELPAMFTGNADDPSVEVPRIPSTLVEAIELWRGSALARQAFGEDVHAHVMNLAEQEWLAFNRHVTDWELRRNFERM